MTTLYVAQTSNLSPQETRAKFMWNAKRTDRVALPRQLRLDPEMGALIRAQAESNRRTIQQELLHLLEISLKAKSVTFRHPRRRTMPAKKKPIQHGTTYAYTVHRCRCERCRAANTAYIRNYRKQTEGRKIA
jgi:hypothetical protein